MAVVEGLGAPSRVRFAYPGYKSNSSSPLQPG